MPTSTSVRRRLSSFALALAILVLQMAPAIAAEITTDLWVYQYGDTVTVTGVDYALNETVEIVTTDPYAVEVDRGTAQTDLYGSFTYSFVLLSDVGGIYDVVGTGLTSGLTAATQFDPQPSIAVTFPTAAATYTTAGWNAGCKCGTSAPGSGGALTSIQWSMRQGSGSYWNGTGFGSASEVLNSATGTTSWSFLFAGSNFPADGSYTLRILATQTGSNPPTGTVSRTFTIDNTGPIPAITLASGQQPLTAGLPIEFNIDFNESILSDAQLTAADIDLSTSTANVGAASISISERGGSTNDKYLASITGVTGTGTVVASVKVNAVTDVLANSSSASGTATVTYDASGPTVTVNQAAGQADPTSVQPILFAAEFNEPLQNDLGNADVTIAGTANTLLASASVTELAPNNNTRYQISVSGVTGTGTVTALIPANVRKDLAGNFNVASTSTDNSVTLAPPDSTPPVVTITTDAADTLAGTGWYNIATSGTDGVLVHVAASDGSGVTNITCVDNGTTTVLNTASNPSQFTLGNGSHSLVCNATDGLGNAGHSAGSTAMPVLYSIDQVAPAVTVTAARVVDHNGWYNAPVAFDTAGTDGTGSGVLDANCTADYNYTGPDGTDLTRNGSCTDNAGNAGNGTSAAFDFDDTNPAVTVTAARVVDHNGWYNAPVAFDTAATDAASGVSDANCTADQNYTGPDGNPLSVNGSCTDNAGNVGNGTNAAFKFDDTNPTVTVTPARIPDFFGWYNAPVVLDTAGSDATSGVLDVNCTADQNYTGPDGDPLSVNGSCTDNAGNIGNGTSADFKFDDTNPSVTVIPARGPDHAGWYNAPVVFDTSGSDLTSGLLDANCTADYNYTGLDGTGLTRNGSCTDNAGNIGLGVSALFDFDDTNPSVTVTPDRSPDHNGWYNAPVTFDTAGTDATSGVSDANCTADQNYTGPDGSGFTAVGSCTDNAGNVGNGTSAAFDFDDTNPTNVHFTNGGLSDGGSYYFGFVPGGPTTCDGDDDPSPPQSGFNACTVGAPSDPEVVGSHQYLATGYDIAGNSATDTLDYTVLAWTLKGFYQPVDMFGTYNVVKGGSTVPLKFEVFAGPTELTSTSVVHSFVQTKVACDGTTPSDEIEIVSTGGTELRYDSTGGQFIQNWKTPRSPGQCYRVTMTTEDGSSLVAFFKLK